MLLFWLVDILQNTEMNTEKDVTILCHHLVSISRRYWWTDGTLHWGQYSYYTGNSWLYLWGIFTVKGMTFKHTIIIYLLSFQSSFNLYLCRWSNTKSSNSWNQKRVRNNKTNGTWSKSRSREQRTCENRTWELSWQPEL